MKKDYNILKNAEKIIKKKHTNFLDPSVARKVINKIKNCDYKIYYPYLESEKVIIYTHNKPKIKLLEIISNQKLKHSEILGSLFSLNIDSELFGDIIIYNNHNYIMVMNKISDLVINELNMIGNNYVKLKKVQFNVLDNYKREYQTKELTVSSTRIDAIVSKLTHLSRTEVKKKFTNNEILLNYEVFHKINYNLKEDDIFSIRKYGKYKFGKIINNTKNNKYIIKIYKYN